MSNWMPQNPIQDLMALFAAGRFADMERQAKALLASAPEMPVLNELCGVALTAQFRHSEAQFWENLASASVSSATSRQPKRVCAGR